MTVSDDLEDIPHWSAGDGLLFTDERGGYLRPRGVLSVFQRAVKQAGVNPRATITRCGTPPQPPGSNRGRT